MRYLVSAVLVSMLASGSAKAQNDQVRRGPAPAWAQPSQLMPVPENASGLVFVRRQDSVVHLDKQGQAEYTGYRIRILHPNALQLGNLSIAWNPASGAPVVHAIKIYRNGEVIDVLTKASFEILRREDQLEAAWLDGTLTAVLRIADLRVGDELEVALTIRLNDSTLGSRSSGLMALLPDPSPGRFRLGLSWEDGQKPNMKISDDIASAASTGERSVEFRFENPAMQAPPKDAPARYRWQRVVEYSDFTDWADISRHFAPLYVKAATLSGDSPLKQEAARIAAAHSTPFDRAAAALKLVQSQIRYIYVGLNGGNLMPVSADETWQRRYGDCKGKTAMLLGLLAELGIKAEAVLVNANGGDDGLNERLPSPRLFDHVLVRIHIDGSAYWLDGTLPPVVPPTPVPVLPYNWILPLTVQGSPIENLPWRQAATPDEITLTEIDARAGFDQPARITHTTIIRGIKGLQQQVQLSSLTPTQLLSATQQHMIGDTWQVIDDAKWQYDQKAQASVLTITGTGTVNWDNDGNGAKSLSLPGGGFSPPEKRIRASEQKQELPYYRKAEYTCHATTVRLPTATRIAHWSFNTAYDTRIFGQNYYRTFELREGAVRMIRGFRTERQEIDAITAKRDNARIASFDNSMAWLYYDPNGKRSPARAGATVPATYEIDWTIANVPCVAVSKTG